MRFDAQGETRAVLESALPGAVVRVTVPNPRPAKFVLVRRNGGSRPDAHRDRAGVGVTCWAPTEAEAYALADAASRAVRSMELMRGVAKVDEESFRSDPDPEDGSPRWFASYTLTTYEIN